MSSQLGETTAKCRPFFDIFDANRIFLCRNIVDYINALWFFTFITILLWSIGTPVGLNMISIQREMDGLKKVQARAAERASDSGGGRRRAERSERAPSTARDRSTSSASRPRAQLRRSATEETLDIADEAAPQRQIRDTRSREREISRSREPPSATATPARSRPQVQRTGTEDFDLDDSEIYGAAATNPAAVAAARRTPPRTAPPPPPLPDTMTSSRNVRWHEEDDLVFEDAD